MLAHSHTQVVERVNKLVLVRPLKTRYDAAQGDVVVGRVTEVRVCVCVCVCDCVCCGVYMIVCVL